jgi:hypothetical protein
MNPKTPKSNNFKASLPAPQPAEVQRLLLSHAELEEQVRAIATLTQTLKDSPNSLLSHMVRWSDEFLKQPQRPNNP